ncbi:MAG: HAD family phosphatase [Bacteroidales bacterium]|nr:HAD family phosphatase [Bacteroidales bacterium]
MSAEVSKHTKTVALFDLDGVIFDTEPQYDIFWGGICRDFMPEDPGMVSQMKGQTLTFILERWFSGSRETLRDEVVRRLNDFERGMKFLYVNGFPEFLAWLRERGARCAVVTSSNIPKMENVYRSHPELSRDMDLILTSEDFARSKPAPDCYLQAAARFNVGPEDCVVFEDSLNGLRSGRAAGMTVVGLATSLSKEVICPLSDIQIDDFLDPALMQRCLF